MSIKLTKREQQVRSFLVRGYTNPSIAHFLGISVRTVETHRAEVLKKRGVGCVVGLIRLEYGLDAVDEQRSLEAAT
jgi:FixJ family two-component response regulator